MSIRYRDLSQEDAAAAGYFRIGHVVLRTPPTDILTNRVSGKDRITVLRGSNDLIKMTGKGRWDVTVRWIAALDDAAAGEVVNAEGMKVDGRYAAWEDLRSILAIFKAAPFVEVENSYIRQALCEQDTAMASTMRMAFGLRQLRVSQHPDIVDALDCSLTMTWFNYFPYSSDFAYLGDGGGAADADRSAAFKAYIALWKAQNLDANIDASYDGPSLESYERQTPGSVSLRWREYQTFKIDTAVVVKNTSPDAQAAVSVRGPRSNADISVSGKWDALIRKYALQNGLSPAMVKAVMVHESSGRPTALGVNYRPGKKTTAGSDAKSVTAYLTARIQTDPDGGVEAVATYTKQNGVGPDFGLMQTQLGTAREFLPNVRPVDLFNPETSLQAGCAYLKKLYASGMTDEQIYAYNTGSVKRTKATPNPDGTPYAVDILRKRDLYAIVSTPAQAQPALAVAAQNVAAKSDEKSTASPKSVEDFIAKMSPDDQSAARALLDDGWLPDFNSNDLMYFYQTHELRFADLEHGDNAESTVGMAPQQVSILMVNNLAQVPLDSYTYPTYQHIGSPSSEVVLGFLSVGRRLSDDAEPDHTGVAVLGGLISFLEAQYLAYRTNWRRVDTVHRMHAVYVQNQILNMLGIRGLTLDNLSTETVPDSADMVQVELASRQYENIFEKVGAYKIRSISLAAAKISQDIVNSGSIAKLDPSEQRVIPMLTEFARGRADANMDILCAYLLQLGKAKTSSFDVFDQLDQLNPSSTQAEHMLSAVVPSKDTADGSATSQGIAVGVASLPIGGQLISTVANKLVTGQATENRMDYPAIAARMDKVKSSGKWTTGDVLLARALAKNYVDSPVAVDTNSVWKAFFDTGDLMQSNKTRIQAVYDQIFLLLASSDSIFASELNTLSSGPAFGDQFGSAGGGRGPAWDPENLTTGNRSSHASYSDLGLHALTFNGADNNPGSYFVDHSREYDAETHKQLELVVGGTQQTAALMNASSTTAEYYRAITNEDFGGLKTDAEALMRAVNIPGLSMAEAYPTFKLFLMEDEAEGIVNCFDNFYSYASVTELEIIRYQDKPDVAVIQITNIANLLMHHLYDDTLAGRYQYGLNPFQNALPTNAPMTGQEGSFIAGRSLSGELYTYLNASDGGLASEEKDRVPLQYFALQPGSKIQIRMGFANNPDLLVPVFTGRATQISSDGDLLVITAESFLGELCVLPTNSGRPLQKEDRGSELFFPQAADTASLIEEFVQVDSAKHFGRFKLATVSDPMLTGLTWTNRIGKAVGGEFSRSPNNTLAKVGAAMASSYDRSGENIMISHVADYSGVPAAVNSDPGISVRSFTDASSSKWFTKFNYTIPKNSTFTSWEFIKDISRRYPELILSCKQYGFPYSADATMVFAHPLDWYYARPPLLGDVEMYRTGQVAVSNFPAWWSEEGSRLWPSMVTSVSKIFGAGYPEYTVRAMLDTPGLAQWTSFSSTDPTSAADMEDRMISCLQRYNSLSGMDVGKDPGSVASALYAADVALDNLLKRGEGFLNVLGGGSNSKALKDAKLRAARDAMLDVRKAWESWLQRKVQSQGGASTSYDRLKPVRRYHFIDHNSIVHNSMRVNDKIYNGVKLGEHTVMANGNIPPHYRRILDVTTLLNDPENNLKGDKSLWTAIAQSFLKEEVGKMYDGEIVLRGNPEIEPWDCLVLLDPSTSITGVVEVDKVIHSFSQETGYITIVYPRALIAVNEAASAGMARMFGMIMTRVWFTRHGVSPTNPIGGSRGLTIADTTAAGAAMVGLGLFAATPPGWVAALLGSTLVWGGLLTGYNNQEANQIQVLPVSRYARPWIGGLEGYKITDMWHNLGSTYQGWKADNIYPLIDSYRTITGKKGTPLPVQ